MQNAIKMPMFSEVLLNIYRKKRMGVETILSQIAKDIDCTYTHVAKLVGKMEKLDWLSTEKVGRVRVVRLRIQGRQVAEACQTIHDNM